MVFSVCEEIRQGGLITPILMLTARGQTKDKVRGLKTGAGRLRDEAIFTCRNSCATSRHCFGGLQLPNPAERIDQFGSTRIDRRGTSVTQNGKPVNLSAREFHCCSNFVDHAGRTISRDELVTQVWGYSTSTFTRTVDVHVASLRQKLESDPRQAPAHCDGSAAGL
jgi:two-component system alkaline phosphatase synthesis response regulator PhoP